MGNPLRIARLWLAPAALALAAAACSSDTAALSLNATPSSIGGDGQSVVTVTAKLNAGATGAPDGTTVHFTATDGILETTDDQPGATPLALDVASAGGTAAAVIVVPHRGRGTINVNASASFNGATVTDSKVITLVPSGGPATSVSLVCSSQNIGGFVPLHPDIHMICQASATGPNGPIKNASIEAYAEAGSITWQFDPMLAKQVLVYTATVKDKPPLDVDPLGPDGSARPVCPSRCINSPEMCDAEPCWVDSGGLTHNPRDGVVTLMVAAPGVADFDSLGEPFVDEDDDGQHSDSEPYIDVNGNGKYDPASGGMEGTRMVWTSYRIIWSGSVDDSMQSYSSKIVGTVKPYDSSIQATPVDDLTVRLNDSNYNKVAATNHEDNVQITSTCTHGGVVNGNAFGAEIPLTQDPGILFDPVSGAISSPGSPDTYRRGTDIDTQTNYGPADVSGNTAESDCVFTATVNRNYDPGASPLFEQEGSLSSEQATGLISIPAPPASGN